jgi:uncharacterized membrane protein HdeD (DUF308 family)
MGRLALALGAASIFGSILAGDLCTVLVGIVFLVSGTLHIAYGLYAKDWRNFLHFLFLAVGFFSWRHPDSHQPSISPSWQPGLCWRF